MLKVSMEINHEDPESPVPSPDDSSQDAFTQEVREISAEMARDGRKALGDEFYQFAKLPTELQTLIRKHAALPIVDDLVKRDTYSQETQIRYINVGRVFRAPSTILSPLRACRLARTTTFITWKEAFLPTANQLWVERLSRRQKSLLRAQFSFNSNYGELPDGMLAVTMGIGWKGGKPWRSLAFRQRKDGEGGDFHHWDMFWDDFFLNSLSRHRCEEAFRSSGLLCVDQLIRGTRWAVVGCEADALN